MGLVALSFAAGCSTPPATKPGKGRRARKAVARVAASADAGVPPPPAEEDEDDDDPPSPAENSPHADLAPSPLNVGWIGGACAAAEACTVSKGECLTAGFPNGLCTAPCAGACPSRGRAGDTRSFCVDAAPFGREKGLCLAECDHARLGASGCPEGWVCAERHRFAEPNVVGDVCVPEKRHVCGGAEDVLVKVPYPDAGTVWVPAELRCGTGPVETVVLLHGLNGLRDKAPNVGGGKRLEVLVRALVDGGAMRPVVLAEPVHFQATSGGLYGEGFDPARHLELVNQALGPLGRKVGKLSYVGHSGAGCNEDNGLYKVLARRRELTGGAGLHLWGLMDVCYETPYHWEAPLAALSGEPTILFNVYSEQGDPSAFEQHLFGDAAPYPCDDDVYGKCLAHDVRPWHTARAKPQAGAVHANNPYFFVREAFPKAFAPGR